MRYVELSSGLAVTILFAAPPTVLTNVVSDNTGRGIKRDLLMRWKLNAQKLGPDRVLRSRIRDDEYRAVLQRFPTAEFVDGERRYSLSQVTLPSGETRSVVVVRTSEQGEGEAQNAARELIEDLDPDWLVLTGIAGAVPSMDFTLGDVVLANRLHDFTIEARREDLPPEYSIAGGPLHKATENLLAALSAHELHGDFDGWNHADRITISQPPVFPKEKGFYGDEKWIAKIKESLSNYFPGGTARRPPLFTTGQTASSDRLIKDTQLLEDWRRTARHIVNVEMELAGVYRAARRLNREYPILAIRGLSDVVGFKRDDRWTEYACHSAASFTHVLISSGVVPRNRKMRGPKRSSSTTRRSLRSQTERQDLASAANKLTHRMTNALIDNRNTINREQLTESLDAFVSSPARYAFILGPSGNGKSILMAHLAQRVMDNQWAVLLLRGSTFSLEHAANTISQELSKPQPTLNWTNIVKPWTLATPDLPGFAILMDAIDEADPDHIAQQLLLLHDSLLDVPLEKLKVVISCRDFAWSQLRQHRLLPQYEELEEINRRSFRSCRTIHIPNFTHEELNQALRLIGATELLTAGEYGAPIDRHIAAVRDLIQHPGTFEYYADLHASGDLAPLQNLTWSELLTRRIRLPLKQATRLCQLDEDNLFELLVRFSALCWEQHSRDFQLETSLVKDLVPELTTKASSATLNPQEALISVGLLQESIGLLARRMVGLRFAGVGPYLLSHELQRQAKGKATDELRDLVTGWIKESQFSLPLDALLAWINRLVENPRDPVLLLLIQILIENSYFNHRIFRLLSPAVIGPIFEIVKREGFDRMFFYKEAAQNVRAAPGSLTIIRRHLRDPNAAARKLAAELAGIHRDLQSQSELQNLLEDSEDDVRRAAIGAFGRIGPSAVSNLTDIIKDSSKSTAVRSGHLSALRLIGLRNQEVSEVLRTCLEDGSRIDVELLQNALLTAAQLRDRNQANFAIAALAHSDQEVVHAAAYYLAEVPTAAAFQPLLNALAPKLDANGARVNRYWVPSSLIRALLETDRERAEPIVLDLIRDALSGAGELYPAEAISQAATIETGAARRIILEKLANELLAPAKENNIWWSSESLGSAWFPEHLLAMAQAIEELANRGENLAQQFVDNLLPLIARYNEYPVESRRDGVPDLKAIVKCQDSNFVPAASQLLKEARTLGAAELCELLWVAADTRAENALLHRLENPVAPANDSWYEKGEAARALGTCGTEHGASAIVDYLRSQKFISIHFSQEAIYPLVQRGVLAVPELITIARDSKLDVNGRLTCLRTLSRLNPAAHNSTFLEIIASDDEELVQRAAARYLGLSGDISVAPALIRLLRETTHQSIKSQAAEALRWLNAREAIDDIERESEKVHAAEYTAALAAFRAPSLLSWLTQSLPNAHREFRTAALQAIGSYADTPEGMKTIMEQFADWSSDESRRYDNQSPLIEGLINHQPNLVLDQVNTAYDIGYLSNGARQTVANLIPQLFSAEGIDKSLLKQTVRRLLCDRSTLVRELSAFRLKRTSLAFCKELYEELQGHDKDEWTRACATHMLGFWESDLSLIESARYSSERLVRQAADKAQILRHKHLHLQTHVRTFGMENGLARLASYLCLKEQGDLSAIQQLRDSIRQPNLAHAFLNNLIKAITERLNEEYRKLQEKENKRWNSGRISF